MVTKKPFLPLFFGTWAIVIGVGLSFFQRAEQQQNDDEVLDRLASIEHRQELLVDLVITQSTEKPESITKPSKRTEPKLKMPWDRMFDCVYDYGLDLRPIDTVAAPNTHNSWVLGGTCETLAHDLRDNEYPDEVWNPMVADTLELQGMCVGYTDDSPIEAAKCQKNMQRWLEVLCWNTLQDPQIRACKRNNLTTSLDHDENERPW